MTSCSLTFSVSSHISHSNPTSFQQQQLAHPPPLTAPRPQSGSRHRPRRRSRQRMQDLAFLGPMERSQPGPSKYNGGHLPPVPYIHRAEEVLVGLATARAQSDKAYAFAIVDGYIRSKKARGQVPSYIASKIELLEARRPVSAIAGTAGGPGGPSMPGGMPSVTQMAAMDRRPPVNRQPVRQQTQEDEAPPPPYSAEDPEPEATRALQESLAAAAEQQGSDFTPEPSHRRANSTSASMVTAQTSLSTSSRRTSGDRPRPSEFPGSPAARAGNATSNGPSAVSSPSIAPSNPTPAADAPPVDTSNMNEEERRAVEESQLEEAMRASRQAEKERLEYEAAVQASLAQAEEDALRRALAYPAGPRAAQWPVVEALITARAECEQRLVRRDSPPHRKFNTNKPLPNPNPSALPPVQEPANESLMDMLASIDFNAPEIKPIQPTLAPQGTGGTGGSRGSFSGASEASIEATVASPQSSSNGSWVSGGTATATNSAAPSLGTTPTQPTYIHHAEPRLKSKNPFLAPEEQDPPAVTVAGPPRPTRSPPPPPPRSDTNETARPESYDHHNHSQYLDPSSAEYDHSGGSSPQYSPNWRGDAHGLTINTSPRSGTAPSLSSAGATVAGLTPSTGSHSPSGFPFPVAVPSGLPPSPRPTSEISPARNLPPIPQSRSAENLPQGPPPPVPPRSNLSHTPSASYSSQHSQPLPQPPTQNNHSAAAAAGALELLRAYDTVFLVDDSGALRDENWEAAAHLLCNLVEMAPEGLDVYFLNSKRIGKALKERIDVEELFAGLVPREGKQMGVRLEGVLTEYIDRLEREGGMRKLNLILVTDGGFAKPVLSRAKHARGIADLRHELLSSAGPEDAEAVLVSAGKRLDRAGFPGDQVGVQFVQLGDDNDARKALQELDSLASVHSVRDMVDTVRYRPDSSAIGPELAAKVLLGGIHRGVDAMA
ncbi:hypothetical protein A1Q1_06476 [Trichosporon asahii var. asahii CBS 2479]|uniref:VWFA domain-containing protein n=1 Tax=Trichosporon asahii var. asahii (strain ATCC 90039 / CBS 2479 / JCM 2466 / KCTC 7840 / NBRC 103889/ NCYC 2677 / UAMH 7654) TaxID=1186058 RepID=J6ELK1_TRIAS|nr:hypothetical protein A1Q1_06476 [Trichosporon asahii var. asahii CBS 2479]EJT45159.1 hypothetical protein A1Q1_06476 [Trichosporon asahii var. asahii CBS 2479]